MTTAVLVKVGWRWLGCSSGIDCKDTCLENVLGRYVFFEHSMQKRLEMKLDSRYNFKCKLCKCPQWLEMFRLVFKSELVEWKNILFFHWTSLLIISKTPVTYL